MNLERGIDAVMAAHADLMDQQLDQLGKLAAHALALTDTDYVARVRLAHTGWPRLEVEADRSRNALNVIQDPPQVTVFSHLDRLPIGRDLGDGWQVLTMLQTHGLASRFLGYATPGQLGS